MSTRFDANSGLVVVAARLIGPDAEVVLRLSLDTGATMTMIHPAALLQNGADPAFSNDRIPMTTASGVEYVPKAFVRTFVVMGSERRNMPVISQTLPPSASVDGLLGLDFFRGSRLSIDFWAGLLDLM